MTTWQYSTRLFCEHPVGRRHDIQKQGVQTATKECRQPPRATADGHQARVQTATNAWPHNVLRLVMSHSWQVDVEAKGDLRKLAPEFLVEGDPSVAALLQVMALRVAWKPNCVDSGSARCGSDEVDQLTGLSHKEVEARKLGRIECHKDSHVGVGGTG
jgi:hypothetical protein